MLPEPAPLFSSFSAPLWFRPFILSLRKNSFWEEKKSATLILQYKTTTIINEWMYKLVNTMRYFLIEKFKNFKKIVLGSKTDTGACFWLFRGVVKRTRIPGVLSYNEQWKSHNYKKMTSFYAAGLPEQIIFDISGSGNPVWRISECMICLGLLSRPRWARGPRGCPGSLTRSQSPGGACGQQNNNDWYLPVDN